MFKYLRRKKKTKFDLEPWIGEPDFDCWIDELTGYRLAVRRVPMGNLTAYVKVPASINVYGEDIANNEITYQEDYFPWSPDEKRLGYTILGVDFAHFQHRVPKNEFTKGRHYVTWDEAVTIITEIAKEVQNMVNSRVN